MKILGLGIPELAVILGIALLIFGPKNLPKLGKTLGKSVKSVRDGMDGVYDDEAPKKKEETAAKPEEKTTEEPPSIIEN